jgi:cell division protein FtsB
VTGLSKTKPLRILWNSLPQVLLTALLSLGLLQLTIWTGLTLHRHVEAAAAASVEQQKITELKRDIKLLRERATQARENKLYLERLARKQGFVKRGETVIVPKVR